MAVVKVKSNLVPDIANGVRPADPELVRGKPVVATGTIANAASDSAGSTYHLADIPAHAILDSRTAFGVASWGFATVSIGTETDVDALTQVLKSAGNTVSPIAFADANHGKPLWQVLGLAAAPPSGMIALYAHAIAAATGAGLMKFEIHYRDR